jgi:hypothetical protein
LAAGADSVLDADSVPGTEESSAHATAGVMATAPLMPSAMARAPIRPTYLEASAENMMTFRAG